MRLDLAYLGVPPDAAHLEVFGPATSTEPGWRKWWLARVLQLVLRWWIRGVLHSRWSGGAVGQPFQERAGIARGLRRTIEMVLSHRPRVRNLGRQTALRS
jgi:hypothetical protein